VTPTRILVVGGGGREHAIAWKLAGEPGINRVHVAPGNAGIAREPRVTVHPSVAAVDASKIVALARREAIELVVIGPEAALAAGLADALLAAGVAVFGPTMAAARIESSKAFCRDVAAGAGVAMAHGEGFSVFGPALDRARALVEARGGSADGLPAGVVIKADGLAAGKGVTVCDTIAEAESALRAIFRDELDAPGATEGPQRREGPGDAGPRPNAPRVVVEERLDGPEASLIALCDGRDVLGLLPARDHKRLGDGDEGPNTGGMGAYTPLPDLPMDTATALFATVHRPILAELARRGAPFRGALYAGFILTRDGPRLLECNARFGDPETQVLLPTLGVAFSPLLAAAARGDLLATARRLGIVGATVPSTGQAAVGIVLAAAGYPATPRRGDAITGLDAARGAGALVFHSATATAVAAAATATATEPPSGETGEARGEPGFVTDGGRVLTVVGRGPDVASARGVAERAADRIAFDGAQRRRDIAASLPPAASQGRDGAESAADLAMVR